MSNLTTRNTAVFSFDSTPVRTIDIDGLAWFVAKDVIAALNLDRKALERLDEDEKGARSIHTPGGQQEMTVVNESGLFSLVLGSRKPEAKRFKRWITSEVLPAIRKNGSYGLDEAALHRPEVEGKRNSLLAAQLADARAQIDAMRRLSLNISIPLPTAAALAYLPVSAALDLLKKAGYIEWATHNWRPVDLFVRSGFFRTAPENEIVLTANGFELLQRLAPAYGGFE